MKRTLLLFTLSGMFILYACGPAAEDREVMHARAKIFQDSIARLIRASMDEAATPGPGQRVSVPDSAKAKIVPVAPGTK